MQEAREHLRKLGTDLLHLEITTLVSETIVSTKMANPRGAVLDLATTYRHELTRQRLPAPADLDRRGGAVAFAQIRAWAQQGIAARAGQALTPEAQADVTRLYEIQDKAEHVLGMFRALQQRQAPDWDNAYTREEIAQQPRAWLLLPHEILLIRKLWEIGLADIAMQTIIQVDGDVITRIHPTYMTASAQPLRDLHQAGVQTSVAFWHELVSIVESFISLFVRRLP